MDDVRKMDTRECIKVATKNVFITAKGLSKLHLKARKLLYLAISQCKKNDEEFYQYEISPKDFAKLMDIDSSNVYDEADKITDELMDTRIILKRVDKKGFKKYSLMALCEYDEDESILRLELNPKMTDLLLNLKGDFSQPLLVDFLKMKSPYSMAIWHLMQREMKSKKPGITQEITFYLTLEELREVTGTQEKLKQVGQFKEKVLDKAIREIRENCDTKITYQNIKAGRTVVGFQFEAVCAVYRLDESKIPQEIKDRVEKKVKELNSKKKEAQ